MLAQPSQCWNVSLTAAATFVCPASWHDPRGSTAPGEDRTWPVEEDYNDGDLLGNLLHPPDLFLDLGVSWPVVSMTKCFRLQIMSSVVFWYFGSLFVLRKTRKRARERIFKEFYGDLLKLLLNTWIQTEKVQEGGGKNNGSWHRLCIKPWSKYVDLTVAPQSDPRR